MNKKNKKGQIETIGLVVIIILLVTIGFIFISFMSKSKPKQTTDKTTLNLLDAIIKTQTPYGEMKQLISDSYVNQDYSKLRTELQTILSNFERNKKYSVKISANNNEFFTLNPCEGIVNSKVFTKDKQRFAVLLVQCNTL